MTEQTLSSPANTYGVSPDTRQKMAVEFHGNGREYFGIWITNILLSIVTLGIYSAWAKVRNKKYFSQRTIIDGRRFDYHATGKQILIGRIIVVVGFVVYSLLSAIPIVGIFLILGLFVVLPWLLVRSLAFNARMTSFSGIRFKFAATKMQAFLVFMLYPLLSALTLYTTIPFVIRAQQRFLLNNRKYGTSSFAFDSKIGPFYKAFGLAIGYSVLALAVLFVLFGSVWGQGIQALNTPDPDPAAIASILILYILFIVAILPAAFIYQAFVRQVKFAGASLAGDHGFLSTAKPLGLLAVAVTNALFTALTLGLYLPWARCRMHGYLAANSFVLVNGSLDEFVAGEEEQVTALGDAYSDIEGLDVDLAL